MKRPYQVTGIVLALFAAFVIRESASYEYMTRIGPGAGFFPFWLGVSLLVMSAIMIYNATFRTTDPMPGDFFPTSSGFFRIGAIVVAVGATAALIQPLGFRLTMLGFLLLLLRVLGKQHLVTTALVALAGSFGVAYVFNDWLKVLLPVGLFGI